MKKLLLAAVLFLLTPVLKAQSHSEFADKSWKGNSVMDVNFTEDGKAYLSQSLKYKYDANDDGIKGSFITSIKLDGNTYTCIMEFTGEAITGDGAKSIRIIRSEITYGDPLPHSIAWLPTTGTLKFSKDAEHPGNFILSGDLFTQEGVANAIELSDR